MSGRRHHPLVLGLTGSIGMGKSTVAQMFADLGVPVFEADAEVHRMQGPGGALLPAIEQAFPGTTGAQGIHRSELAGRVFHDPEQLALLEAIVHPAVAARRQLFLAEHAGAPLVVFDIPLLFEKTDPANLDAVVVVSADAATQRSRVLARPGMSPDRFAEILDLQMLDSEKRARADYVIDTSCDIAETRKAVAELVGKLTE